MTANLRPMNLGEILDRTVQIYRERFWVCVAISALPALAMRAIYTTDQLTFDVRNHLGTAWLPGRVMENMLISLGFYHLSFFFAMLVSPAFIHLTSGSVAGKPVSLRSAFRFFLSRSCGFLWIAVLRLLAGLLIPELIVIGILLGLSLLDDSTGFARNLNGFASIPIVAVPALIGYLIFLWLLPRLSLAFPAGAIEQLRGIRSLRRSWQLSRGTRSRILIVWLALFFASWATSSSLLFMLRQLAISLAGFLHTRIIVRSLLPPAYYTLNTVFSALLGPILPIALTLFYYDQRIRREGYDIEWMMQNAGLTVPPTPPCGAGQATPEEAAEAGA
jgi:hypothetical protein